MAEDKKAKKKKKNLEKKKNIDIEELSKAYENIECEFVDETGVDCVLKQPISSEDGRANSSGYSKMIFFATILGIADVTKILLATLIIELLNIVNILTFAN